MQYARLRRLRRERGLTQAQLADLIGLNTHQPTIGRWERRVAVPRKRVSARLALIFGEPASDLLKPDDGTSPKASPAAPVPAGDAREEVSGAL